MLINLYRYNSDRDHTNGLLLVNNEFVCYTLEDEYRSWKVKHETRIPDGKFKIKFRTEGGFHERYKAKFGSWHKGMLELQDVPNFQYILIHIGNDDDDTSGCILVGDDVSGSKNWISGSTNAYKNLYPMVRNALSRGEDVEIEIKTLDNFKN